MFIIMSLCITAISIIIISNFISNSHKQLSFSNKFLDNINKKELYSRGKTVVSGTISQKTREEEINFKKRSYGK